MPLDARFLHWLQTVEDELLSPAGEVVADADEATLPRDGYGEATLAMWEARAQAIAAHNAAAREDDAWPSL